MVFFNKINLIRPHQSHLVQLPKLYHSTGLNICTEEMNKVGANIIRFIMPTNDKGLFDHNEL